MDKCKKLYEAAHRLLYPDCSLACFGDGYAAQNTEVLLLADTLFDRRGTTPEEEGRLCLSVLMGYCATIYDNGDKIRRKQVLLDRIAAVLPRLEPSLLRCRLLTYCYGEVFDEKLAEEALCMLHGWESGRPLTEEEEELRATLSRLMQYPSQSRE